MAIIPTFLHLIPLAALAAMLVYTGFRLTHPTEFVHIYRIGREQLAIFITTMVMVVVTDLLVGVLIGVILKVALHLANGFPFDLSLSPTSRLKTSQMIRVLFVLETLRYSATGFHSAGKSSKWALFRSEI